jgi:predicted RNA binding protein with dsRBD fold (UPF0201 family)
MTVTVRVFAFVHPTEIEDKVRISINNIFPIELSLKDFGIPHLSGEGNIETLRKLHMLLRQSQILDSARNIFLNGIEGNTTQFSLNKQVAFMGKVNFSANNESLGSIDIEITGENEDEILTIIDWLAPHTVDGKPEEEIEL